MSKTHTPGPWKPEDYTDCDPASWFVVPENHIGTICEVRARLSTSEANARLIAAAPELLEALERVLGAMPFGDEPEFARAAIAKARGEEV